MMRPTDADVIVVGGGIAGMAFAEHLMTRCAGRAPRVLMLSKAPVEASNSYLAQGGIAAVVLPEDSVEQHVRDTMDVGAGLCDPRVVRLIVEEGPASIARLLEAGARFDAHPDGRLQLAREGGHSQARVVHYRDTTGAEIVRVLRDRVAQEAGIQWRDSDQVIDLLVEEVDGQRRCIGVRTVDRTSGEVRDLCAPVVVLATGGTGQVYRHTTNPPAATGDGIAMAMRAGVPLRGMAFIQFHPTALYNPGPGATFLISEAVRGAGARLLKADGHPLMQGRHPKGDLAPRNVVARGIHREIVLSGKPHVWLDTTPIGVQRFAHEFPNIANACGRLGLVAGRDLLPVMPAAHYSCGGIATDDLGRTRLQGLYAMGECASTGLHGADRLASNSLLEALVMPQRAAESVGRTELPAHCPVRAHGTPRFTMEEDPRTAELANELRQLMTREVGILRTKAGLAWAHDRLAGMLAEAGQHLLAPSPAFAWLAFRNLVQAGLAITRSAQEQTANCGTHWVEELASVKVPAVDAASRPVHEHRQPPVALRD